MAIVSLTDCCHLLAVDPKTLRRWMSLSGLSALPHPTDARQKCITPEQVQQLASAHRRALPDQAQPKITAPATSTSLHCQPVLSNLLPDFSPHIADFTKQLLSLQAHIATWQHQLTLLTDQLQKEQEWRRSQAVAAEEKSQVSSQENSQEKSQRSSREKSQEKESARSQANASLIDQRKITHVLPLVEYGAQDKYVVISPEHGLLNFEPDSPEWFAWLATLPSFRFRGKLGRFTVHRGGSMSATRGWRASRRIRNRSYNLPLGLTPSLTVASLERAAATLQSHLD